MGVTYEDNTPTFYLNAMVILSVLHVSVVTGDHKEQVRASHNDLIRAANDKLEPNIWLQRKFPDDKRSLYRLKERQCYTWDEFEQLVEDAVCRDGEAPSDALRQAALNMLATVTGIRADGGWGDITDYTTKYSVIINVARIHHMSEETADESVQGPYAYIPRMVWRFMTRTSGAPEAEPTPMDWILDTRTYGMHIQYNTPATSAID
ncbi:uncharacterized protein CTRU02_215171 [Colletotrichum truncatum]|uniref:Uncharacterized protein n=1 Tax=Colletotrichum truncatum TaxID=5467 RepID=A0ACC3YDN5_COLTU